ncbi:hypothetical protein NQ315_007834 [Exocentrus adspersus]|uniref:Uncharacterized protein n=1 Tax=Exocentrus adspersus TaxID=1586481 RepID=A0AAV8W8R5_9CUCU|nr:hypothetical protein NQ315_007834 [Exocentrus adspersus]
MKLVLIVAVFVFVHSAFTRKFPANFSRCRLSDPDLDNCLKTAIEKALHLIGSKGISSLNLPPIDPLKVSKLEIAQGTSAVKLVQKYTDLSITGVSSSKVENAHFDSTKKIFTFKTLTPNYNQEMDYDVNGKILVVPVYGSDNVTSINTIAFEEETRNNKSYYKIKSYKLSLEPSLCHVRYDGLFEGNEKLGATLLKTINDNWRDMFDDIKDGLEAAYAEVFKSVASGFFNTVPIQDIFLS